MENRMSNYVRILKEICAEEGISLTGYSSDWAFRLERDGKRAFILGYQFGLNPASSQQVCKDKNITSEVLTSLGIPCVFHTLYMTPSMLSYVGSDGSWISMSEALKKGPVVVKDNYGTGGNQVYLVRTQPELEKAAAEVFARSQAIALCPYEEILTEYRLIVLDGEVKLAFEKIRPSLTGDGEHSIRELVAEMIARGANCPDPAELERGARLYAEHHPERERTEPAGRDAKTGTEGSAASKKASALDIIPAKGDKINLNWKHNLGQGAAARRIGAENTPGELKELALAAALAVGIRFGSVDIIRTEEGIKVLEINAGVMMEHYAGESRGKYLEAKEVYREAVLKML